MPSTREALNSPLRKAAAALRPAAAKALPMALGVAALLAGLWTSLDRLGFKAIGVAPINHGPLMVGGFVGTLIALERAIALGRPWGYLAPASAALSAVLLLASAPYRIAALPLFLSSVVLLVMFAVFVRRTPEEFMLVMALGAVAWAVGNGLLAAGWIIPRVVPWWAGFLILTVAGERIEMSRLQPCSPSAKRIRALLVLLYVASLCLTLADQDLGVRLGGAVLTALAFALAKDDIARRTVKGQGVAKYAAICILTGYAWLAAAGVLGAVYGQTLAGLLYDAWTHAQFVGFVLVMIMAHAPIIFPAVLGIPIEFSPLFYGPVILLQISLVLRVGFDLALSWYGRQWSGAVNVLAVLFFLAVTARAAVQGRRRQKQEAGP